MEQTILTIIEMFGTCAFAISGIRLAAAKRFDWSLPILKVDPKNLPKNP